ncbi:MAG: DUF2065 domain-containing protein [Deltaproteobacteria bacterium]|nr:DUF2065 domain-containing protein [Deltaproteobacteria bacterium]
MKFLLSVLGALLVIEGIPYFGFPGKVKDWALVLQDMSDKNLRVMGLIIIALGLALLYSLRFI